MREFSTYKKKGSVVLLLLLQKFALNIRQTYQYRVGGWLLVSLHGTHTKKKFGVCPEMPWVLEQL